MATTTESFVRSFMETGGQIYELADEVAQAGFWKPSFLPPLPAKIDDNVKDFCLTLFAHILLADGDLSSDELSFINGVTKGDFKKRDAREFVETWRKKSPEFLEQLPAFIEAAIRCDEARGTRYAAKIIDTTERLANILVACDGDVSTREAAAVAAYIRKLWDRLPVTLRSLVSNPGPAATAPQIERPVSVTGSIPPLPQLTAELEELVGL